MTDWSVCSSSGEISGSSVGPTQRTFRVTTRKTNSHLYSQVLSANGNCVVLSVTTLGKAKMAGVKITKSKLGALLIGRAVAVNLRATGLQTASFDRLGFKYHGHIKTMAEAARNYGLAF